MIVQNPTQPSRAGSIDGISTVRANGLGCPARRSHTIAFGAIVSAITSRSARSTCVPRAPRRVAWWAVRAATAAYAPPSHSPSRPPAAIGGRSGVPRAAVEPHHACSVNSVAGRRLHGPPWPKGEMDTNDTRGLRGQTGAGPSPSSSIAPGPTLSTTRSASPISARTCARPAAVVQSTAALRFEVFRKRKSAPSSPAGSERPDALQRRSGSPPSGA